MGTVIIHKKIESETLHLPELKPLIGKTVEITVREEPAAAASPADWDAAMQAARALDNYDFDAWRRQREVDRGHATDHLS
jgi:hypothetical protein